MVKGADAISTVDRMFLRWLALRSRELVYSLGGKGLGGAITKVNNGSLITAIQIAYNWKYFQVSQ